MRSKQSFVILNDRYHTTTNILAINSVRDIFGIDRGVKVNFILYINYNGGTQDQCYYDSEDKFNYDIDKLRTILKANQL